MITPGQIDEWLREIEARPESAAAILRSIASRLSELDTQSEALQAENILLRSGKKVEEYESRIAALTFQVDLLKRQFAGTEPTRQADETKSLLLYQPSGNILRLLLPEKFASGQQLAHIASTPEPQDAQALQVVSSQEELLFLFDSGRVATRPAAQIPASNGELDWAQAAQQERRGMEMLACVLDIGRLPLYEFGVQVSRRSFVRILQSASLSTWINRSNVGTGVLQPFDRTFALRLAKKDDRIVIASHEGVIWNMAVRDLPYAPEEAVRLAPTDWIESAFVANDQTDLLAVTQNGKVFHREMSWLEPAHSFKGQGQTVLSSARLEAGVRLVSAAAVSEEDWAAVLTSDGQIRLHSVQDLFNSGVVPEAAAGATVVAVTVFQV